MEATRKLYVPAAKRNICQRIASKAGDVVAWTWADDRGRFGAVAFMGKSQKPAIFGVYRTADSRRAGLAALFESAASAAKRRDAAKAEKEQSRAKPIGLKMGDVLKSVWGYEQTNVDYYEVVGLVGSQSVSVRKIACQSEDSEAFMQGRSVPAPGDFVGEAKTYRVSLYGNRDSIRLTSYSNAYRMEYTEVEGIRVYASTNWTAYA
jgi:hypothetical protein